MTTPVPVSALVFSAALLLVLGQAEEGWACSVCAATNADRVRNAYEYSCAILGIIPLASVGGLWWWMKKRYWESE